MVLRTVRFNRGSYGSLFFSHRTVLEAKEPQKWVVRGYPGQTVRSGPGFKTLKIIPTSRSITFFFSSSIKLETLSVLVFSSYPNHMYSTWTSILEPNWYIRFNSTFGFSQKTKNKKWIIARRKKFGYNNNNSVIRSGRISRPKRPGYATCRLIYFFFLKKSRIW